MPNTNVRRSRRLTGTVASKTIGRERGRPCSCSSQHPLKRITQFAVPIAPKCMAASTTDAELQGKGTDDEPAETSDPSRAIAPRPICCCYGDSAPKRTAIKSPTPQVDRRRSCAACTSTLFRSSIKIDLTEKREAWKKETWWSRLGTNLHALGGFVV